MINQMSKALGNGKFSNALKEKGNLTFGDACLWVKALPYKRNSEKSDVLVVIKESCGTCSSKHELIKRLADEIYIEGCQLMLCIFKMSGANTPKVRSVLEKFDLDYILEAHTYMVMQGCNYDFTFPGNSEFLYLRDVLVSEEIIADQITTYKTVAHKAFLKKWSQENEIPYAIEELWQIRELCIASLSE
jgi:hypothetical protein